MKPQDIMRDLELLLHPRVPPLVRSMPHVESLSLFRAEESQEEIETRRNLKLGMMDDVSQPQSTLLAQPAQLQPSMIVSSDTRPQIPLNPTSRQVTETPLVSPSRIVSSETVTRSILGSRIPEVPTHNTQLESPSVVTPPVLAPIKTHPSENGTTPMTNKQTLPVPSSVAVPVPLSPIPSAQEIIDALPPPQEDEDEPMPSIDMDSDSD